ncbi:MAG: hypothetical protein CML32_08010, partial [Rhodobacteraceae bacterium]|nr:hypothetical protein [Paracoccaceae bacterium]
MTGVDEAVNSLKQVVLELEQKMQSRTVHRVEQLQQIDELKAALSRQHYAFFIFLPKSYWLSVLHLYPKLW